ncbi:MAG: disulfide bond formation protein B [Alphaproteobacteria bacterium]|nr:disulfide bond formation protein B [Alphaproteobacteria bacterium]
MISILSRHKLILGFAGLISALALAAAFGSEIFLGLEPCILCVYQRYPFAIVMFVSFVILAVFRKSDKVIRIGLVLCAIVMLVNSGIASYHTGIEQHWWEMTESCDFNISKDENETWLENIMSRPMGRCDEIPWQDPFIGLSMANYNIGFCFGLFLLCLISAALKPRPQSETKQTSE